LSFKAAVVFEKKEKKKGQKALSDMMKLIFKCLFEHNDVINVRYTKVNPQTFSNSLIVHQVLTKEIMTVALFGYLILIRIDFHDFIFPFSP